MSTSGPYHHGDLTDATLAAARTLLASTPAERISVRELARATGVSHAAPYRHFGDRDGFLAALASACFAEFLAAQQTAYESAAPGQRLQAVGAAYVGYGLANPHAFALIYSTGVTRPQDPVPPLADLIQRHSILLRAAVSDAVTAGLLATHAQTDDVGAALWSLVHGLTQLTSAGLIAPQRIPAVLVALLQDPQPTGSHA